MLTRLKELREEHGISQRALAEVIGVSQQSINKYENHNIEPDIGTLILIADYFETSVDFLIGHTQIRRKIEKVYAYELTQEERSVLDSYRKLCARQRNAVRAVIESYA